MVFVYSYLLTVASQVYHHVDECCSVFSESVYFYAMNFAIPIVWFVFLYYLIIPIDIVFSVSQNRKMAVNTAEEIALKFVLVIVGIAEQGVVAVVVVVVVSVVME